MTKEPTDGKRDTGGNAREARLKAALKANMAKRKAQARARAQKDSAPQPDGSAASNKG